jgi:ParB family chromosome partitioning protein
MGQAASKYGGSLMAKLKAPVMAGYNAGKNYYAKLVRISDIVIDPEISKIFKVNEKMVEEIYQNIVAFGYDESQPVVLYKGTTILLDGHTRLAAAKKAGLEEIPAVDRAFEDRDEAILYTFRRQVLRRNLTGAEILTAVQMFLTQGRKKKDGTGRAAEQLAEWLDTGVSTIYHAQAILKSEDEEIIEAVQNGDMSLTKGYKTITKTSKPDVEFDAQWLPGNIKFLKAAVILLVESAQPVSANLLIKHFLRKNERAGFAKLLPESIRKELEDLDLLSLDSK